MRKLTLPLLTLLLSLIAVPPAAAQGFSGFLRGISNTLSGGSNQPAPAQSGSATATIGVRGMDEDEKTAASQNVDSSASLKAIDTWAATKTEAEAAAKKRGLKANSAAKLSVAVAAGEAQ
jgi:hypothetical protein